MCGQPTAQGTLWVCVDCMIARESAEVIDVHNPPSEEPWNLIDSTEVAATGDVIGFDGSPCDGCGIHLPGERYGYAWFE